MKRWLSTDTRAACFVWNSNPAFFPVFALWFHNFSRCSLSPSGWLENAPHIVFFIFHVLRKVECAFTISKLCISHEVRSNTHPLRCSSVLCRESNITRDTFMGRVFHTKVPVERATAPSCCVYPQQYIHRPQKWKVVLLYLGIYIYF